MKRNRFAEKQIIGILKEHEAGVLVADLSRKHVVSDAMHLQMEGQSEPCRMALRTRQTHGEYLHQELQRSPAG